MRNSLLILALIAVSVFSTSSVFAEGFDESKRSERLGLSFYDGRPLYVASFTVPYASGYGSGFDLYRVNSGDTLSNYGDFDSPTYSDCRCEYVRENGAIVQRLFFFYCVDDDGEPVLLGGESEITSNFADLNFVKKAFASTTFTASSGDVGVYTFDVISQRSKLWLLAALGFSVAFFWVFYCYRLLIRMSQGAVGVGLGGASDSSAFSGTRDESNFSDFLRTSHGSVSDNVYESDVSNVDAYATGEAFDRTFSKKVVVSNVDLQNEWSRLSEVERAELLGDVFESDKDEDES